MGFPHWCYVGAKVICVKEPSFWGPDWAGNPPKNPPQFMHEYTVEALASHRPHIKLVELNSGEWFWWQAFRPPVKLEQEEEERKTVDA